MLDTHAATAAALAVVTAPVLHSGVDALYETPGGDVLRCTVLAVRHRPVPMDAIDPPVIPCRPCAPIADTSVAVRIRLVDGDGLEHRAGDEILTTALRVGPADAWQGDSMGRFAITYDVDESAPSGPWFGI